MNYRMYPNTTLSVSEVGFGLWTTATDWWGTMTDAQAVAMLHEAFDLGITLFDAADTYGNGRSETQLAAAFKDRRDKVVYATKFGYDFYSQGEGRKGQFEITRDFSPSFVRFALEQSLSRLQTERIDMYQVHNAHMSEIENDELFALLEACKAEGKIAHYGVALGPAIGWLYEGIDSIQKRNIASVQMIWSLLEQYPGAPMVEAADSCKSDTGFMVRVPHASGMLEGKYTAETVFPEGDHRRHRPKSWLINGVQKVEQLRFLQKPDRTLGQAAIQWLLREPRVVSVLPNIYDREQLLEFAGAAQSPQLSEDEVVRIDALYRSNFGLEPEKMNYKGTMTREGATVI